MTITARFPGVCRTCGNPIAVGDSINWERGVRGATHATPCPPRVERPAVTLNASPIADFLAAARARGLRYPKVRFLAPDGRSELRLVTAGERSRFPGSISVTLADTWIGRIMPDGQVHGRLSAASSVLAHLTTIATDPARYAREYGRLTCRCSFCALPLTDAGSVEVGYGPICADHYGLPHVAQGSPDLRPIDSAPRPAVRRRRIDARRGLTYLGVERAPSSETISEPDWTDAADAVAEL